MSTTATLWAVAANGATHACVVGVSGAKPDDNFQAAQMDVISTVGASVISSLPTAPQKSLDRRWQVGCPISGKTFLTTRALYYFLQSFCCVNLLEFR